MYPPPPPYTNDGFHDQPYAPGFIIQPPPPPPYYPPPGPMPTPPHAHPMVVTTSHYVVAVPQAAYKDYTGLSILNVIACCLPVWIIALFFSLKSREALRRGDASSAAHHSAAALRLNILGIIVGTCGHMTWITYIIYYIVTRGGSHNYSLYG